jgi:site-specific recombinase XerD
MNLTRLQNHHSDLLVYLQEHGYSPRYIQDIKTNINWILQNNENSSWQSYQDAYFDKVRTLKCEHYKAQIRCFFGTIQRFDLKGELPARRQSADPLIKRGAYHQLTSEFSELIDFYKASHNLQENSINSNASAAASFLYSMQQRGIVRLDYIQEEDVLSYFLDDKGNLAKSSDTKWRISTVFKVSSAWKEEECKAILAFLPQIRFRRKNIPFLKSEEVEFVRQVVTDRSSALSLRDRAIGTLLLYTGIRAGDIASMTQSSINWHTEEIRLLQKKSGKPLVLPLTISVGNAIHDYLVSGRPQSSDPHLFLSVHYPYFPLTSGGIRSLVNKIYREAGIRQDKGDRRGTHLFRHNLATSLLGGGVPRPVISQVLGHTCSFSLDPYLHADTVHLRQCALSIEEFPVSEEVFP